MRITLYIIGAKHWQSTHEKLFNKLKKSKDGLISLGWLAISSDNILGNEINTMQYDALIKQGFNKNIR